MVIYIISLVVHFVFIYSHTDITDSTDIIIAKACVKREIRENLFLLMTDHGLFL